MKYFGTCNLSTVVFKENICQCVCLFTCVCAIANVLACLCTCSTGTKYVYDYLCTVYVCILRSNILLILVYDGINTFCFAKKYSWTLEGHLFNFKNSWTSEWHWAVKTILLTVVLDNNKMESWSNLNQFYARKRVVKRKYSKHTLSMLVCQLNLTVDDSSIHQIFEYPFFYQW